MAEDAAGSSARASSSAAAMPSAPIPPPPSHPPNEARPPPPAAAPSPAPAVQRQRFEVELRPGETTIVSWKKLIKEASKAARPSADIPGVDPAVPSDAGTGGAVQLAEEPTDGVPPPSRFSAVIEKIERLYMGKESSDEEELNDIPDEDQYDTEDSFIDDAELDEYFQVDNLKTKHDGYFVNRGKLERIECSSSPNQPAKKRRRRDSARINSENDHEHIRTEPISMENMRIKAAARNAPLPGKKLSSPVKVQSAIDEHYRDEKLSKHKLDTSTGMSRKIYSDNAVKLDNPLPMTVPSKDAPSVSLEPNNLDKHKAGASLSRDLSHRPRGTSESVDGMHQAPRDKRVSFQGEFQPKKLLNGDAEMLTRIWHKEKNGTDELPGLNSSKSSSMRVKEGSAGRPKGTTLERAIRDLEKIVGQSRPSNLNIQGVDAASQAIKKRLPQEIKQKLGKVARLSAGQAKITEDELVDRLMGILGHLVQRKTLKRNMKKMVELGLSAKQQKADRFHQIKKEIHEMIRAHVSLVKPKVAEQQDGSADDFRQIISNDERRALKGKYSMDKTLEDKICDLYDLYVEGMDEDRGPQSMKLYAQLSELWPNGHMDHYGIKEAIHRSKERKRALHKQQKIRGEERIRRRKLVSSVKVEEFGIGAQVRVGQERSAIDSTGQVLASQDKLICNQPLASSGRLPDPSAPFSESGHHNSSKHYDKARGDTIVATTVREDESRQVVTDVKKKMKRKPESDIEEELYALSPKPTNLLGIDRPKSHKQKEDSNAAPLTSPATHPSES